MESNVLSNPVHLMVKKKKFAQSTKGWVGLFQCNRGEWPYKNRGMMSKGVDRGESNAYLRTFRKFVTCRCSALKHNEIHNTGLSLIQLDVTSKVPQRVLDSY